MQNLRLAWTYKISRSIVRALAYRLALTELDLQRYLTAHFPIETRKYLLGVRLHDPWVRLDDARNRIAVGARVELQLPGGFISTGVVEMEGVLSYSPQEGAFYLFDPQITDLQLHPIPGRYLKPARAAVRIALSRYVAGAPVFQFRMDSLRHRLARALVKNVEVRRGKLRVRFRASRQNYET
ncbi:DUF1439 domain-containing protein [Hahella sp. CR1]|uniref:DUF1439 domain-containing protein n=1 Tax=Hahella sp. CR1 TaxID=2992807 RepID=UPI002440F18D|nr:DUF1439 domain-containing protein [Hahella sp. CR1]MDG9666588.1 DUF1439 domain-containing protein [Hahella sp. CR1]